MLLLLPDLAAAQPAPATPVRLLPVVVNATRTETPIFDVPASIASIDADSIRDGRMQVNLSESLGAVPGVLARDRQNYAQDVQISVRGFGARSTFGIRGVRLYVDDIPATLPDGQGQTSNVDLGSADRIEVLRGPFSALYGNSSGGVIQVFTEEGRGAPALNTAVAAGSAGALRVSTKLSGSSGNFGYVASVGQFTTDGYRDHSAARRTVGNLKLRVSMDEDNRLSIVANSVDLPLAQDPLGLSRAQFDANPRGVDASAQNFDTRKSVGQTQGGLVYERRVDASNSIRALVYGGHRRTEQFQSIPVATQANPLHPGGVISLQREYGGTDLRWTVKASLAQRPVTLVMGVAYDGLSEHRLGFQNFVGSTLGVAGELRRDEQNGVANFDQYLQAEWKWSDAWSMNVGVRHSIVRFDSHDSHVVGPNKDDSGRARYEATLPVVGAMFAATPDLHVYLTAGRGFETPTLNELAYRSNGETGLNFGLKSAGSDSLEMGVKARLGGAAEATAALFETHTSDEIVTQTNVGGRSTFQNAGSTRRRGVELAWSNQWLSHLRAQAAYTWLDARYTDGFSTCAATPCAAPNQSIPAGNRIPGIARSALFASLVWAPPLGWRAAVEARALSRVFVNDANSDAAAGYGILSASTGYVARIGAWSVQGFGRVDNAFGRRYAGSVIVNEGNARYFEPAPGRSWLAGASASLKF